jgi:hypothetical protein
MITAFLLAFVQQQAPSPAPTVTIPRAEATVTVDGELSEPVWAQAAKLSGFRQYQPIDGRPAEENTEVLVWYAPDAIYFGIRALDSQPDRIRATQADRDNIQAEDQVIIYLDTFADRRRAFFFAVNPIGVQGDGVRTEGAGSAGRSFGGNVDNAPDFLFQSRGRVTSEGYIVEVRIPFKSLRFPSSDEQRWGLQVERKVQRTGYTDTWTDTRRAGASFLLQAGTIEGLRDLRRGVVFEAQPFVTLNSPGGLNEVTGEFARADTDLETGANLRVGFTNISLDATINPDFSQVESDAGQVTVNERFALFFPEKRPFFLEGIELFNTPGQLVYTRRIADPIAGAKVTGKLGPIGVAHLTALDENVDFSNRDALFNITRLRHDFGSNSIAGVTYTDRAVLDSNNFNRVLSADVRYVFKRLYFFETQFANSWTGAEAGNESGQLWKVELDRTGRRFGFNYAIDGTSEDFRTQSGFVNRTGIIVAHAANRFSFYGAQGARVENVTIVTNPTLLWNYNQFGDGDATEGDAGVSVDVTLRGGWQIEFEAGGSFFRPDPDEYSGLELGSNGGRVPYIPPSRIDGRELGFEISTPNYRKWDAAAALSLGEGAIFEEAAVGHGTEAQINFKFRPTTQIRLTATGVYARITRERDGSEFARSLIPRIKAEYQATRHLFVRSIVEYANERRAALVDARTGQPLLFNGVPVPAEHDKGIRLDALISYEPTPGTVAYVGYGSSYAELSPAERRFRRTNDGFFVKLAYQFRR